MREMRTLWILVALLVAMIIQPANAQRRGWEKFYDENLDNYVQFGLENGMNLSWAHRFQQTDYLRYGVDFAITDETRDFKEVDPDGTSIWNNSIDAYNLTLHIDYIKPIYPYEAVRLYLGAGPLLGLVISNTDTAYPVDPNLGLPNELDEYTSTTWKLGARGLIGGEYALNSRLSFFAEVSVEAYRNWRKSEFKSRNLVTVAPGSYAMENTRSETEYETWRLDMSNVMIGVTFRYGDAP